MQPRTARSSTGPAATVAIPAGPTAARQARRFVAEQAALHQPPLDAGVVESALLCVSELVTNAVRHGRGAVGLRVLAISNGLRIEVSDADSHPVPAPSAPPAHHTGGRGLLLVAAVSSRWGADLAPDGSGKTVWCEVDVLPVATAAR